MKNSIMGKARETGKMLILSDESDSEKAKRIAEIKKVGLRPIIRVLVKDLTEKEAFLIEKTLIWKLGKTLTNKSTGHFAENFVRTTRCTVNSRVSILETRFITLMWVKGLTEIGMTVTNLVFYPLAKEDNLATP